MHTVLVMDNPRRRGGDSRFPAHPTIHDVARLAMVSVATVSRSFTTPQVVKQATRERVLQAAGSIGYRPNPVARGLITGQTSNIGVVVPDMANPFFPTLLKAIQAQARCEGMLVFMVDTEEDPNTELELIQAMSKQVDGLILCSSRMSDERIREVAATAPLAVLNRRIPEIPAVAADYAGGMEKMVSHLAGLGHQRCVYVGGSSTSRGNRERLRGIIRSTPRYRMELVALGPYPPHFESGVQAVDEVLQTGATAVICYNDLIAMGLMAAFAARGIRVPTDISVSGFDGLPMAAMFHPAVTTVHIPTDEVGSALVDMVLESMRNGSRPQLREVPTELIVRSSTGPPPGRSKT